MNTYQGLIIVRAEVDAENAREAREKLKDLAMSAGLVVEQVTSVRNLAVHVLPDGTNGPRETITDGPLPAVIEEGK